MGNNGQINDISDLVVAARAGDLVAYRTRVRVTQGMVNGYGLERFAMFRYGIDDIRKIDVARVA